MYSYLPVLSITATGRGNFSTKSWNFSFSSPRIPHGMINCPGLWSRSFRMPIFNECGFGLPATDSLRFNNEPSCVPNCRKVKAHQSAKLRESCQNRQFRGCKRNKGCREGKPVFCEDFQHRGWCGKGSSMVNEVEERGQFLSVLTKKSLGYAATEKRQGERGHQFLRSVESASDAGRRQKGFRARSRPDGARLFR